MTVLSPCAAGQAVGHRRVAAHLVFRRAGVRTFLAQQRTPHPFHITLPFHLASDPQGMATLYLQSSAGGLYGDDDLTLDIETGPGSSAHVTTQASSIVHAARGGRTRQAVTLRVGPDSFLEYLPDPAILFAEADLETRVTAHLAHGARVLLCDSALAHDPSGGNVPFARLANTLAVHDPSGRPIAMEHGVVTGVDWQKRTGALPVHGLMMAAGAIDAQAVHRALCAVPIGPPDEVYAASCVFPERGVVVFRILAADGAAFSAALDAAWCAARMALTGTQPRRRRK
jgi:urease accessory protein